MHVSVANLFFVHVSRFVAGPGGEGRRTLAPSSLSRAIPLFRCLLCRAFFSAGRRSREPHFRLPRDLFPPDSFSRLIGSFQAIYGASQGDRVISFGLENGHDLYRVRRIFASRTVARTIPMKHSHPIFGKIVAKGVVEIRRANICVKFLLKKKRKERKIIDQINKTRTERINLKSNNV